MEVMSKKQNIRISPRKLRLVAPLAKGLPVEQALLKLRFTPKDAAKPIMTIIKTAAADAVHNHKLDAEKLVVKDVQVSEGPTYKRFQPVSRGMSHGIAKRTSHITVTVEG